jgi:hypothetical protein
MLIDGTLTSTVGYYQTFPTEPTVKPDSDFAVQVPVDAADKLNPITLLSLLTRMLALPPAEKHLLIVTHGNEAGIPIPLAPGSDQHAEEHNLHTLTEVGKVVQRIPDILKLALDKQPFEFAKLLKGAKNLDGSEIFPHAPPEDLLAPEEDERDTPARLQQRQKNAVATYQAIVQFALDAIAGKSGLVPDGAKTGGAQPVLKVTRRQLDELLDKGNRVRGRFERIDFRGCYMGESTKVLEVVRAYFGCRQVCAPDVLAFDTTMTVVVDAYFDKNLDRNIDAVTQRQAVAGRAPVKIDRTTDKEVTYPTSQIPATRRFDADKARKGDEVFIRMWITDIDPSHRYELWMRAVSQTSVVQFVQDKISADISRWKLPRASVPINGLWLVDDYNTPPPVVMNVNPNAGPFDQPQAAPPPPSFALPRDPEYRQHLICVP